MQILIDSPIWSLALRRRPPSLSPSESALVEEWARLVQLDLALLLGPIRQELLSGIRETATFERLRAILRDFDNEPILSVDYEQAAEWSNRCRSAGVATSAVDTLLCGVAARLRVPIFTTDEDFKRYSRHIPFRLHRF